MTNTVEVALIEQDIVSFFTSTFNTVISVYIFGSRVNRRAWAESDIDVAVLLDEPDSQRQTEIVMKLADDLRRKLDGLKVDVVCLNGNPNFAYEVLRTGSCVYCSDDLARSRFEKAAYCKHFDILPFEAICRRYLLDRIRDRKMLGGSREMIDRQSIENLLAYIQEMLNRLQVQQGKSFEEFSGDFLSVDASLRELQTLLESVSDIATHIVAGANLGAPADRPEAIELLAKHSILSQRLANRIVQAVRLRNILVHHYPGVNLQKVYDAIQNGLGDIVDFCAEVNGYLDEHVPNDKGSV